MKRPLKDLEAYILGVVGQIQPCTPYKVMKFFLSSPSVYYSGSAGAIYPAITRLEEAGLLKSSQSGSKGKRSKSLSLTAKGLERFSGWFDDRILVADGGYDPLRARMSLIRAFPEKQQTPKIKNLLEAIEGRLKAIKDIKGSYSDDHPFRPSIDLEQATLKAKAVFLKSQLK